MPPADEKLPNRLIDETSPYLRQHAFNPVDWRPWGDEAFEAARREDKPVFLSIGYLACHWCHVMERESFDDEETARLLNDTFVCVKVDREERPDIDQHYMTVCQMMTGTGGWPLTILLTPGKEPFFATTYLPPTARWGRPGLRELAAKVREAWTARRASVERQAREIAEAVLKPRPAAEPEQEGPPREIDGELLDETLVALTAEFDETHGGFGRAPKFPMPHNCAFLLRYWKRTASPGALAMVTKTLDAMSGGGICDQLGGGFHRYSTDAGWRFPHFEKMLHDQALLASLYVDAFLATGSARFGKVAARTLDYVLRELAAPGGGFFGAQDADSEGEEGRYYTWTPAELAAALEGDVEARSLVLELFSLAAAGGHPGDGEAREGRGVLVARSTPAELAAARGLAPAAAEEAAARVRDLLLEARSRRVPPARDTKVLADWNGLAIGALAKAGRALREPRYLDAARGAAAFVRDRMRTPDGRLLHCAVDGEARVPAFLDDYAFVVRGLIELYQSAFDLGHLEAALDLAEIALGDFWDEEKGGFFFVVPESELPARPKEAHDGALPSGNSVMLGNLLRLSRVTGRKDLEDAAAALAAAFSDQVFRRPQVHTELLCGIDFGLGPAVEIVVTGGAQDERTQVLLKALARSYQPGAVVLLKPAGDEAARVERLAPFTAGMREVDGRPAAHVCLDGACLRPVTTPLELLRLLTIGSIE